jgi:limonene-1,2-epoxide hydrolase
MKTISLAEAPSVIRDHLRAVNGLDLDAILATFSEDAYVNDNRREIRGPDALRAFFAREFVGDSVSIEPVEVIEHHGDIIVRGRYDGTYDKTNLPEVLVMSSYFTLRDGRIVALAVIFNQPSPYGEPAG